MKKQYIIIIAIITLIVGSLSIFFLTRNLKDNNNDDDDGSNGALVDDTKVPDATEYDFELKMNNQGILENLIIRNYMVDGIQQGSTIEFELVNNSEKALNIEQFSLSFYDNTNTVITTVPAVINTVNSKERKKFVLNTSIDLKFAVKYTVDIIYK